MSAPAAREEVRPEEYFRVLFEQAVDAIFISSPDGVFTMSNPSACRMLGYTAEELVGKRIPEVIGADDRSSVTAGIANLVAGRPHTKIRKFCRKDGTLVEAEVIAQRLSDGSMMAIVRDLGPRYAIEQKARASEARSRSILETAPDTIMAVDRAGTILFINRTVPPFRPEQVIGTPCFDYVPPESRKRVEDALHKVFTDRVLDEYEVQGPPALDGERRWSSVRAGPLMEGDQVVAAILCATNVTERRRDEERIRELASRLQKIASQVPGMVFQFKLRPDGSSCFPYASDRIRELLRLTPEEVRDDASRVFALLHPADLPGVLESIGESSTTLGRWHHEGRVVFPDGEVRWLDGNAVPEHQSDGSTVWHGFIHDITARKEAEIQRAVLEEQLRQSQKVEGIGKLAGGVAHDFNNLLTSVMGFVHLAKQQVTAGAPLATYLQGIQESAERGAALTQQLLAFARKKIVRPEVVSLNEVLARMTIMLRRLVGENLELVVSCAPDLGLVRVDVGSLEQVIMNLVVNARDAIADTGRITLQTADVDLDETYCRNHVEVKPGPYVMLAVRDTGAGMTHEVLARVFEPFFTTKPVGQGTGLGLAMCYGIAKQAGGHIVAESTLGAGSSFFVYLPRAAPSERPGPPERAASAESVGGRETILLVEDEPMIVDVIGAALAALGYRVLTAPNGSSALELVSKAAEPIHLLITDVIMPKMGGADLAKRLSALRPGLRVLFTSGHAENAIVERGVLGEGIQFLQKPYTPSVLAERVRQLLDS